MAKTKLKKKDYIRTLAFELTPAAWECISMIQGQPLPDGEGKRQDLLNKVFHKITRGRHGTSRNAGQDLQKQACGLYSAITGIPWASSRDDDAEIKPRQSGQAGVDVVLSPRAKKLLSEILKFPTNCECKNTKSWNLQQAIRQAMANTPDGEAWMLVVKRRAVLEKDRIDPVVVMDMGVFQDLIIACINTIPRRARQ